MEVYNCIAMREFFSVGLDLLTRIPLDQEIFVPVAS